MTRTLAAIAALLAISAVAGAGTTVNYGDHTLSQWQRVAPTEMWDLTKGDLRISYTLDFNNVPVGSNYFQAGIVGCTQLANYDTGVWLQTRPASSSSTVSGGYEVFDGNDHMLLQRRVDPSNAWPTTSELYYDVTNPASPSVSATPFGTYKNVGFYYDRGAVTDPVQQGLYGWADGGNYNTGGIYHVELLYKALSSTQGVVFTTINGVQQGMYAGSSPNYSLEPDFYPVGLSFTADDLGGALSCLNVWFGQGAAGTASVENFTVQGYLIPAPGAALLGVLGCGALVAVRRRLH